MRTLFRVLKKSIKFLLLAFTSIIRLLVKKKVLKDQYHIDIDGDGQIDLSLNLHHKKEGVNSEESKE